MRQTILVAVVTAAVTALVTAWGTTMIMASGSKHTAAAPSFSMDISAITKNAAVLPVQAFDAF